MSLKRGSFFAEGGENALIKETELCECRVLDRAHMTLGKNEAVTICPSGILGIHCHFFKVAGGNELSCGKRSAGMSGLRCVDHRDDLFFQHDALFFKISDTEIFFHIILLNLGNDTRVQALSFV
jgi:hypothetical protein